MMVDLIYFSKSAESILERNPHKWQESLAKTSRQSTEKQLHRNCFYQAFFSYKYFHHAKPLFAFDFGNGFSTMACGYKIKFIFFTPSLLLVQFKSREFHLDWIKFVYFDINKFSTNYSKIVVSFVPQYKNKGLAAVYMGHQKTWIKSLMYVYFQLTIIFNQKSNVCPEKYWKYATSVL